MPFCGNCGATVTTKFCVACGSPTTQNDPRVEVRPSPVDIPAVQYASGGTSNAYSSGATEAQLPGDPEKSLPVLGAVGYGFRHAASALRRAPISLAFGIILSLAVAVYAFEAIPHLPDKDGGYPDIELPFGAMFFVGIFLQLGVIQEAVRTSRPTFKYDAAIIIQALFYNWLMAICQNVAILCLGWPFFWFLTKTAWTVPEVFSPDNVSDPMKGPWKRSWDLTTGAFWESLAFQCVLYLSIVVPLFVVFAIATVGPAGSEIVSTPLLLLCCFFGVATFWTAMMRFYDALILRHRSKLRS